MKFKVGRPEGGDNFRIVGESQSKSPQAGSLNTYTDVGIPVEAGDVIGLYFPGNTPCLRGPRDGYLIHYIGGDAPPGTAGTFGTTSDLQFDLSAILEADCDADGLGDETQDPGLPFSEACGKGSRALTLDANKNKVKKGKKVTLSGRLTTAARQGPCDVNQSVELQRKRPSQASYTAFTQVQTDSQGSFSLKRKVKKTFEFRAQVVETAACTPALSNSEKVKVKKKKTQP
jgi:hypothetical protein